jgi:AcrR family transcriptional regulator
MSREDQTAERRRALLEATVSVIGKLGLIGLTIKEVANEAGCSFGVVAFHFHSKERLILAALDHVLDEYEHVRHSLSVEPVGSDAADPASSAICRLTAMIESDFDKVVSSPRQMVVWMAFWAETARNPDYRQRCAEVKIRYRRSTADDMAALATARGIEINVEQASATLNAIVDGYWVANLVLAEDEAQHRSEGRQACLAYLESLFPGDFSTDTRSRKQAKPS